MNKLVLSSLAHTWILDLDGTIVKHNGHVIDGQDTLLPNVGSFLKSIPENDMIIFLTARDHEYKSQTEFFLKKNGIRYDEIIFDVPYGERVLINDCKPSGLKTAYAVNVERDRGLSIEFEVSDLI